VKKKRTIDSLMGEIFEESIAAKDRGEKVDMEYVHKRAQERMYENEYGRKPPTKDSLNREKFPEKPQQGLRRLLPFEEKLFENDPWPLERERPLFPQDAVAEFTDASDEYLFWEIEYLKFIRASPYTLRKTLPLLHEAWCALSHRLLAAENRFVAARNKVLGTKQVDPTVYAQTEERVKEVRMMTAETFKSQVSPSPYDPSYIRGTRTGPILKMTEGEFADFEKRLKEERVMAASNMI